MSGISKRVSRHTKQEVCPFNVRFAEETTEPRYAERGPGELPTGVQPLPRVEGVGEKSVFAEETASGEGRATLAGPRSTRGRKRPETFQRKRVVWAIRCIREPERRRWWS